MSLCTMLRPWRYLRALARLYTMALPSRSVYLVEEVIASKRSPPYRTQENTSKRQPWQCPVKRGKKVQQPGGN